eukprot:gene11043-14827_t
MSDSNSLAFLPTQANLNGKKIAVFGLSANPPTGENGHGGIVKFLVQNHQFDEVWVMPVFHHVYSSKRNLLPFEDRMRMCQECFSQESTPECAVRVVPLEKFAYDFYAKKFGVEYRMGSYDVVCLIKTAFPDVEIHFIVGTDTYNDIRAKKWKESDKFLNLVYIHVITRKGIRLIEQTTNEDAESESLVDSISHPTDKRVFFHEIPWLLEVSSTVVRTAKPAIIPYWPFNMFDKLRVVLHPKVYAYLRAHKLFGFADNLIYKFTPLFILGVS